MALGAAGGEADGVVDAVRAAGNAASLVVLGAAVLPMRAGGDIVVVERRELDEVEGAGAGMSVEPGVVDAGGPPVSTTVGEGGALLVSTCASAR